MKLFWLLKSTNRKIVPKCRTSDSTSKPKRRYLCRFSSLWICELSLFYRITARQEYKYNNSIQPENRIIGIPDYSYYMYMQALSRHTHTCDKKTGWGTRLPVNTATHRYSTKSTFYKGNIDNVRHSTTVPYIYHNDPRTAFSQRSTNWQYNCCSYKNAIFPPTFPVIGEDGKRETFTHSPLSTGIIAVKLCIGRDCARTSIRL